MISVSIRSLVPTENKYQSEEGKKLQAIMFLAAVEVAIIGCHAKKDPPKHKTRRS